MNPYLIASYPRSGSTYLRFIIANLFYPQEHNFDTVNRFVPAIDDVNNIRESESDPLFYKTHALRNGQNIIHLHRHVGDVLISEYWYKQKFHKEDKTLYEWLFENDYGRNWRASINHYFPCKFDISYDELSDANVLVKLPFIAGKSIDDIQAAIDASSFEKMQESETQGFGIYPSGDEEIKFIRKGLSGQWHDLDEQTQKRIIDKNYKELKILGYL